jgi:hypothetical protein
MNYKINKNLMSLLIKMHLNVKKYTMEILQVLIIQLLLMEDF